MQIEITKIPFNAFLGLQPAASESDLLLLPASSNYLNHLGSVHASAQLALAEAASGEFLLRHLPSVEGLLPVVRRVQAKFRRPAKGAVLARAHVSPDGAGAFAQRFEAKKARTDYRHDRLIRPIGNAHPVGANRMVYPGIDRNPGFRSLRLTGDFGAENYLSFGSIR